MNVCKVSAVLRITITFKGYVGNESSRAAQTRPWSLKRLCQKLILLSYLLKEKIIVELGHGQKGRTHGAAPLTIAHSNIQQS